MWVISWKTWWVASGGVLRGGSSSIRCALSTSLRTPLLESTARASCPHELGAASTKFFTTYVSAGMTSSRARRTGCSGISVPVQW